MWNSLSDFYTSREWSEFRRGLILERGFKCEYCGELILNKYDLILHHEEELTLENVNDYNVSLNPSNIKIVHHKCHNEIHKRFGSYTRHIYLVYGPPGSGKTTFVNNSAGPNDLVIDIDSIFESISVNSRYTKPNTLLSSALAVRDTLLDRVRTRNGKWSSAYIIGGYPRVGERERLCEIYGAEEIFIECSREECLARVTERPGWNEHVERWFAEYTETPPGL